MHWHKDGKARASEFYGSKGRRGKKMTGGNSRVTLLRQKHEKMLPRWRKAFLKRHGRKPDQYDERASVDGGRIWDEICLWTSNGFVAEVVHNPETCPCHMCRNHPTYIGPHKNAAEALTVALERLKKDDAAKKAAEDKREAGQKEWEEKECIKAKCPIPFIVLTNWSKGLIPLTVVQAAFPAAQMTQAGIERLCWAFNLSLPGSAQ